MDFPNNRHGVRQSGDDSVVFRLLSRCSRFSLASSAQAQRRVTLEWDRNADPHTLGYMVSAGLSSGNYIAQFNVGTQNRLQLDLPHGGAYYVVVRAYDALGRFGPASPEMVIDLTGPPREPTALRAHHLGGTYDARVEPSGRRREPARVSGIGRHRARRGRRPQQLFGRVGPLRKRCAAAGGVLRPRPGGEPAWRGTGDA